MRQPVCPYSEADRLPEAFHRELSTQPLGLGNRHGCDVWHVMSLDVSKEHPNENPIKHRNRWHTILLFYLRG